MREGCRESPWSQVTQALWGKPSATEFGFWYCANNSTEVSSFLGLTISLQLPKLISPTYKAAKSSWKSCSKCSSSYQQFHFVYYLKIKNEEEKTRPCQLYLIELYWTDFQQWHNTTQCSFVMWLNIHHRKSLICPVGSQIQTDADLLSVHKSMEVNSMRDIKGLFSTDTEHINYLNIVVVVF